MRRQLICEYIYMIKLYKDEDMTFITFINIF